MKGTDSFQENAGGLEKPRGGGKKGITVLLIIAMLFTSYFLVLPMATASNSSSGANVISNTNYSATLQSYQPYVAIGSSYSLTIDAHSSYSEATIYFGDGTSSVIYGSGSNTVISVSHSYSDAGFYYIWYTIKYSNGPYVSISNLIPVSVVNTQINQYESQGIIMPVNETLLLQPGNSLSTFMSFRAEPLNSSLMVYGQHLAVRKAAKNGVYSSYASFNLPYAFHSGGYSIPYSSGFYNITSVTSGFYEMLLNTSTATINPTTGSVSGATHLTTSIYDFVVNESAGTVDTLSNLTFVNAEASSGSQNLDPQINYNTIGGEILSNTLQPLVGYQGSNDSKFFPSLLSYLPTPGNGINTQTITRNLTVYYHGSYVKKNVTYAPYQVYNFTMRNNVTWQDGTSVTSWDAAFSIIRDILFAPLPSGTPGWILAQRLLPGNYYQSNTYQNITNNVTWYNKTDTFTLYFQHPMNPLYLYALLTSSGTFASDANWMYQHGEGLQFTPSGFSNYLKMNSVQNPQSYVNSHVMSDGPYILKYFAQNNRVILSSNPDYNPPASYNGTEWAPRASIQYVDLEYFTNTTVQSAFFKTGNAQSIQISSSPWDVLQSYLGNSKTNIITVKSYSLFWINYNARVNISELQNLDPSANLPSSLFANLYVRLAFAYAFNDKYYINDLLNNNPKKIHLGTKYAGIIPNGMRGSQNVTYLNQTGVTTGVPYYNIKMAKQYWNDFLNSSTNKNNYGITTSGMYNGKSLNIPMFPFVDPPDEAIASLWSANLSSVIFGSSVPSGGGISVVNLSIPVLFGDALGYGPNPGSLPIYWLGWAPDYPYPDDYLGPMANPQPNESYPHSNSMTVQWFSDQSNPAKNASEINTLKNMTSEYSSGISTSNMSKQMLYFHQMNQNLVNMSFYVYLDQGYENFAFASDVNISRLAVYNENQMIMGLSINKYNTIQYCLYPVIVTETGLPSGNKWFVNLTDSSSVSSSSGSSIVLNLHNGTYNYTIGTANGSYFVPPGGSFTVNGHSVNVNVKFVGKIPYTVTFRESGLSSTGKWYVNITGLPSSGSIGTPTYTAHLVNGSYTYKISTTDKRYEPAPRSGTININGGPQSETVSFSELLFGVTFTESGLPSGTHWDITIQGNTLGSSSTSVSFSEPNGTYIYTVSGAAGYSAKSPGAFTVTGSNKAISVPFVKNATLRVDVKTTGAVFTVNGKLVTLNNGLATVSLAPGSYFLNATKNGYYTYTDLKSFGSKVYYINITLVPLLKYGYLVGSVIPGYAFISASGIVIPVTGGHFNQSLSPGQYLVSAEASGYVSHDYLANITQSKTTYLNISLKKASLSYVISGQVKPVNASIMFGTSVAYVNSTGYYDISLPKGTYSYSVTDTGYFPSTGNISVDTNLVVNFKLIAEPPPQSVKVAHNITALGYNVTISNLTSGNGNISLTYTSSANGTLVVMLPYSEVKNATVSDILSSKVYINRTQYSNFTVALSSINGTFSVILTVYGLKGDPILEWAYSPSVHVVPPPPVPPPSNKTSPTSFFTTQIMYTIIAVGATIALIAVGLRLKRVK